MLQLKSKGPDLWDSIIPEEARALPEDLAYVDELLRDERFMKPFLSRFDQKTGRRGLPVATYLRLMYLRRKNRLSYEALAEEVSSSIPWRSFCGIGCQDRVPSPSTVSGLTQKYGEETLQELYRLVSEDLREWKIQRRRKGGSAPARRGHSTALSRALGRLGALAQIAVDQARRLAARIKDLRLRRKLQMTLNLPE
ncbi:MAG: transposase [Elusimicrobiota bacterium]